MAIATKPYEPGRWAPLRMFPGVKKYRVIARNAV
jgi:hypothetical protein